MPEQTPNVPAANPKGSSDAITRAYLDSLLFEERLIGSTEPTTAATLFGIPVTMPIMTAAFSGLERFAANGTMQMSGAVRRLGTIMWMGISEDKEVEAVAATGVPTIEIIKPYAEQEKVFAKLEHGKQCGCAAMGMDIDHCFAKNGSYGTDRFGNPMRPQTVSDLRSYVAACGGTRFIVKGVLSVHDAAAAAEAGASAIVLSHHHGIYPFAVPPLMMLPEIRKAVGPEMTIIVDSCIRDGFDAFKALALGADGVCVGRALQQPLHNSGAQGVYEYLSTMNDQLRSIMGRTGTASLRELDPSVIRRVP